jgi:hypothetical protein
VHNSSLRSLENPIDEELKLRLGNLALERHHRTIDVRIAAQFLHHVAEFWVSWLDPIQAWDFGGRDADDIVVGEARFEVHFSGWIGSLMATGEGAIAIEETALDLVEGDLIGAATSAGSGRDFVIATARDQTEAEAGCGRG